MGANLAPDGVKLLSIGRRIGHEGSKVMEVEEHAQALVRSTIDDGIHTGENAVREDESRRRSGVEMPGHWDAHVIEPSADLDKIAG